MNGCSLYRFFDVADRLLYVGITSIGPQRWVNHETHKAWWPAVVRVTVETYATRDGATVAERRAIREEGPLHNVKLNGVPRRPRAAAGYRKHGEGTLSQRSDTGRWIVGVTLPGRRRYMPSFGDEHEARLILAALLGRGVRREVRERAIEILQVGEDWRP